MEQKYYLREKGKNVAYSLAELQSKKLKKSTKIWVEGSADWQRLDRIPELNIILERIPPRKNRWRFFLFIGAIVISILGGVGYYWYKFLQEKTPELIELSSEELYNKYESAVVLIKHTYYYEIKLGDKIYYSSYFNNGEAELKENISDIRKDVSVVYGTGFIINSNGDIITNRHLLQVNPTEEEQNSFFSQKRDMVEYRLGLYVDLQRELENRLNELRYAAYYTNPNSYEYSLLEYEWQNLKQSQEQVTDSIQVYELILNAFVNPTNSVSVISNEVEIFFNKEINIDNKDGVKYKITDVSEKENVDLALLSAKNINELSLKKFNHVDLSLLDSIEIKPRRMNERVRMIGFNNGLIIAETTNGINSQLTEGNISQVNDLYKMLYTIPAIQGSSGSPIFDKYGRVVSVNFAGFLNTQNFNYGIQTKQLQEYLVKNNKVHPKLEEGSKIDGTRRKYSSLKDFFKWFKSK